MLASLLLCIGFTHTQSNSLTAIFPFVPFSVSQLVRNVGVAGFSGITVFADSQLNVIASSFNICSSVCRSLIAKWKGQII